MVGKYESLRYEFVRGVREGKFTQIQVKLRTLRREEVERDRVAPGLYYA